MSIERILELAWLKAIDIWAQEKDKYEEFPNEFTKSRERCAWKEVKTIEYLKKEVEKAK